MCRPSHLLWPVVLLVLLLLACSCSEAREISIDEHSTISNKMSLSAAQANAAAIARAFATAESGDTVVVPANNVYYALGGIKLWNKHHLTIRIEGKVVAYEDFKHWPRAIKEGGGTYDNFIDIRNCTHIHMHGAGDAAPTFKEIEKAYHFGKKNKKSVAYIGSVIDGRGLAWWNKWIIDPILGKKLPHRPKLIGFKNCTDLLLEKFTCVNSPSYHVLLADVARVEVNNVNIFVDRALKTAVKTKINLIQYLQSRNGEDGEAGTGDQWMVDHPKVRAIFDAMAEIERDAKTQQSLLTMSDSLEATRTEDGFAALLKSDKYPGIQAQDLNTDGFDPSGRDVWIHDCHIINDDDCIAVKPANSASINSNCSENMLIEDMVMAGVGASIGSVPPNRYVACVRNITFRRIKFSGTAKAVYVKSNPSCGVDEDGYEKTGIIENILYEDLEVIEPLWWPIWIGPQQQQQPGEMSSKTAKCPLFWPLTTQKCYTQSCVKFNNITLRRVTIKDPTFSPGVLMGDRHIPMTNIHFEDVNVKYSSWYSAKGRIPFYDRRFYCEHASGTAINSNIAPPCLKKTSASASASASRPSSAATIALN